MCVLAWGQDLLVRTCQSRPLHRCSSRPSSAHAPPCLQHRVAARMSSSPKRHRGPLPGRPARRHAAGHGPGKSRGGGGCPWLAVPVLLRPCSAMSCLRRIGGLDGWSASSPLPCCLQRAARQRHRCVCGGAGCGRRGRSHHGWYIGCTSQTVLHALVGILGAGAGSGRQGRAIMATAVALRLPLACLHAASR